MIDFSKLSRPPSNGRSSDPEEIFRRLPKLRDTPNDLWSGQTDALREWHRQRTKRDVLISLNTGAGKTLVGLLIAQSLVNEEVENVLYLCSTVDLVNQTCNEANKLGIKHTARTRRSFSNDFFDKGQAFCVTTYHAAFQPFTVFKGLREPGAVVFDDAHTAENILRNFFTIQINSERDSSVYRNTIELFEPIFRRYDRHQAFIEVVSGRTQGLILAPPIEVNLHSERLTEILASPEITEKDEHRFKWGHLKDHIKYCTICFAAQGFEVAPAFLPSLRLPLLDRKSLRRIYLSATLNARSDFARTFGKRPDVTINPPSGAGEGERLILFSRYFKGGEISPALVKKIAAKTKILVAVPSYYSAKQWEDVASPPSTHEFSAKLQEFRSASAGAFILVGRYDGIDLPDDTCRLMIIDGLPSGSTLLDKFLLNVLGMKNAFSARIANRVTQLFGRINRGRKDFGVFIVSGKDVETWLGNHRNLALVPTLLRQQVVLGQSVQEQERVSEPREIYGLIQQVLEREEGWIDFYSQSIGEKEVSSEAESQAKALEGEMTKAALAEAEFAAALWDGVFVSARRALERGVEDLLKVDSRLAGWHNAWIGFCYECEGDKEAAVREYGRAKARLSNQIILPVHREEATAGGGVPHSPLVRGMLSILNAGSERAFDRDLSVIERGLAPLSAAASSSNEFEEALRVLGETLGFEASRPDNDDGSGPDILWRHPQEKICISFEAKNRKEKPATYGKEDIGQGHNHIQWVKENCAEYRHLGLIFVGPDGRCSGAASPSDDMYFCSSEAAADVGAAYVAALRDIRNRPPLGRHLACEEFERASFTPVGIFGRLASEKMCEKKTT